MVSYKILSLSGIYVQIFLLNQLLKKEHIYISIHPPIHPYPSSSLFIHSDPYRYLSIHSYPSSSSYLSRCPSIHSYPSNAPSIQPSIPSLTYCFNIQLKTIYLCLKSQYSQNKMKYMVIWTSHLWCSQLSRNMSLDKAIPLIKTPPSFQNDCNLVPRTLARCNFMKYSSAVHLWGVI